MPSAYAEQATIERVVAAYSAHVPVPIVLKVGDGAGEKTLADGSALWRKPKSAIEPSEYNEFYGHVSGQYDEPALTIHYKRRGAARILRAAVRAVDEAVRPVRSRAPRPGRSSMSRRVFITDEAGMLPAWLRFVRGVIDSEDLPLNISREMLQKNPMLEAIGKGVTNRMLADLDKLAESDQETLREGLGGLRRRSSRKGSTRMPSAATRIYKVARFKTTTGGDGWRSLADYVAATCRPNQTAIYYALGDSEAAILASPQLEGFARRGVEVLLLADPVDAFWVQHGARL